MFEHLAEYDRIIVTGPQRSGTRICSAMIANDTGNYHVDERLVGIDCINQFVAVMYPNNVETRPPMVVQCPGFSRWVHRFPELDQILVVWMVRPIDEIEASEKRIGLKHQFMEQLKYPRRYVAAYPRMSEMKYMFFEQHQKRRLPNLLEVKYHDLKDHPFWVPKSERDGWESNRIANDDNPVDFNRIAIEWANAP